MYTGYNAYIKLTHYPLNDFDFPRSFRYLFGMYIELFTVCGRCLFDEETHHFNVTTGSIDGLVISSSDLPYSTKLEVAASIIFEPLDEGTHIVKLELVDQEGARLKNISSHQVNSIVPTSAVGLVCYKAQILWQMSGGGEGAFHFPKLGTYSFNLYVDEDCIAQRAFYVVEQPPPDPS